MTARLCFGGCGSKGLNEAVTQTIESCLDDTINGGGTGHKSPP